MTYEPPSDHSRTGEGLSRRGIVKGAAAAGLLGTTGTAQPSSPASEPADAAGDDPDPDPEHVETPDASADGLNVGGRLVVGTDGYDTIQDAWDDADDGDTVYVHSSYDAQAAGEAFPIVIDQREKQVALVGGHPSGSEINAEHVPDTNVVEVYGAAHRDFRNTPLVRNLKIVGGKVGLKVAGAPNAAFSHLKLFKTNSHGAHVTVTDEIDTHTFGTRWYDCEAWSCGGSGFRTDAEAGPHGTTFIRCNATWNGWNGNEPGVALRGFSSVWQAGTIQRSAGHGLDLRAGSSQVIRDTYFEGNGMHEDHPVQIHANGTIGLVIDSCYFLGRMQSPTRLMDGESEHEYVKRGITLYNTHTTTLRDCTHWYHEEGFVAVRGDSAYDNDLNEHSHHSISDTDEFLVDDAGNRTRSNGVIREQDMRAIDGRHDCDRGIHDGSGSLPWGPVVWTGDAWMSLVDGSTPS